MIRRAGVVVAGVTMLAAASGAALGQDAKAWAESQGLEVVEAKAHQEFEAAAVKPKEGEMRGVILRQGKPLWQSNPKDADPGSKWTVHSIGRDLDGDGQPDVHFSTHSGGPNCCTTHLVYRLKPQVRRTAVYSAGSAGGSDFIEIPGRKAPVMISADDASANAFAPYSSSYFPVILLEVSPKGRFQFAQDLMKTRLPGQPPPVCSQAAATANPWLKERCSEYTGPRRQARSAEIKSRLGTIKASRAADKIKWEDYYATGVLGAVAAEMNRYAYTGHGNAALNWLETIWPGNDAIKLRFLQTLRQTQGKSAFAGDLKTLASEQR